MKAIEECTNCEWLSKLCNLDEMIEEDGEVLVNEELKGERNGHYISEGQKKCELICENKKCKASWIWEKHWITDNGGKSIKRNGVEFDF